jgi:S-formylglutathione hydrolase FrmB
MGGLGAIKTALRFPKLFSVVAANSPALVPFSIWDSFWKWVHYFGRHPIDSYRGTYLIWDTRRAFRTRANFDLHDPVLEVAHFAENFDPGLFPKFYFDVGNQDFYGFQEGFARLKMMLDKTGYAYTSDFYPNGTHDIENEPVQRENLLRWLIEKLR